jgi:hypothetical protein
MVYSVQVSFAAPADLAQNNPDVLSRIESFNPQETMRFLWGLFTLPVAIVVILRVDYIVKRYFERYGLFVSNPLQLHAN